MNKSRLLKLAKLLEADAKNPEGARFDLGVWATAEDRDRFPRPQNFKRLDCNTTACAVGLACLSGAFRADGLRWASDPDDNNIRPMFKRYTGFTAVEKFFGIDNDAAIHLFASSSYWNNDQPTRGHQAELAVAKRIREFVAEIG
jgi:hypothetical protein